MGALPQQAFWAKEEGGTVKWDKVKEILSKDGWMKHVLFEEERALSDPSFQKSLVEENITHIMFRPGPPNPDWRPVYMGIGIHSFPQALAHPSKRGLFSPLPATGFDEYSDDLGYSICYHLVFKLHDPEQTVIKRLDSTHRKSVRWDSVGFCKRQDRKGRRSALLAVVRQISIVSQSEYLMNGYDVFKLPLAFNPMAAGWYKTGQITV